MNNLVILLSGAIASGKTTLAKMIVDAVGGQVVKTRAAINNEIMQRDGGPATSDREALQAAGDRLDEEDPAWLLRYLAETGTVVVDAVRKPEQVATVRATGRKVLHVHLFHSERDTLLGRLDARGEDQSVLVQHPAELRIDGMAAIADRVLMVDNHSPEDVLARIWADIGLRSNALRCLVDCLVGGQYGSEGKGHIVAHIAREYRTLLRVGGPNAGHTVVHPMTGKKISFYHLPSGALHAPLANLVLGPGAVINPEVLKKEAEHLGGLDKLHDRLSIDPQAMIINDRHIAAEAGVVSAIGSTGQGVGAATIDKISRLDVQLARDYRPFASFIRPTRELLDRSFARGERALAEGTQGTGLSLHHGHYPHVTSRDTTVSGTLSELGIPPHRLSRSIVVLRSFPIRVSGPSGPMGHELTWEQVAEVTGDVAADKLREAERTTTTKRLRRVAAFSFADLQRAVSLNGPTELALTFTDYLDSQNKNARRMGELGPNTKALMRSIETACGVPVTMVSTGTHEGSVVEHRT